MYASRSYSCFRYRTLLNRNLYSKNTFSLNYFTYVPAGHLCYSPHRLYE